MELPGKAGLAKTIAATLFAAYASLSPSYAARPDIHKISPYELPRFHSFKPNSAQTETSIIEPFSNSELSDLINNIKTSQTNTRDVMAIATNPIYRGIVKKQKLLKNFFYAAVLNNVTVDEKKLKERGIVSLAITRTYHDVKSNTLHNYNLSVELSSSPGCVDFGLKSPNNMITICPSREMYGNAEVKYLSHRKTKYTPEEIVKKPDVKKLLSKFFGNAPGQALTSLQKYSSEVKEIVGTIRSEFNKEIIRATEKINQMLNDSNKSKDSFNSPERSLDAFFTVWDGSRFQGQHFVINSRDGLSLTYSRSFGDVTEKYKLITKYVKSCKQAKNFFVRHSLQTQNSTFSLYQSVTIGKDSVDSETLFATFRDKKIFPYGVSFKKIENKDEKRNDAIKLNTDTGNLSKLIKGCDTNTSF